MTFSFLWFAVGLAVGVNVALAGLWWSLRREKRKAQKAIDESVRPGDTMVFDRENQWWVQ